MGMFTVGYVDKKCGTYSCLEPDGQSSLKRLFQWDDLESLNEKWLEMTKHPF